MFSKWTHKFHKDKRIFCNKLEGDFFSIEIVKSHTISCQVVNKQENFLKKRCQYKDIKATKTQMVSVQRLQNAIENKLVQKDPNIGFERSSTLYQKGAKNGLKTTTKANGQNSKQCQQFGVITK